MGMMSNSGLDTIFQRTQNISADWYFEDDQVLGFGNSNDYTIEYDSTDDRFYGKSKEGNTWLEVDDRGTGTIWTIIHDVLMVENSSAPELVFRRSGTQYYRVMSDNSNDFKVYSDTEFASVIHYDISTRQLILGKSGTGSVYINGVDYKAHTNSATSHHDNRYYTEVEVDALFAGLSTTLDDLTDTTITTIGAGEILKWDGVAWINNTLAESGISATGHAHTESDITDLDHLTESEVVDHLEALPVTTPVGGDWVIYSDAGILKRGLINALPVTESQISDLTHYLSSDFDTDFATKTTTNLTEGTNLYYTQARFDSAFTAKSTTDLSEGTNLYYTDARVESYLTTQGFDPSLMQFTTALDVNAGIVMGNTNISGANLVSINDASTLNNNGEGFIIPLGLGGQVSWNGVDSTDTHEFLANDATDILFKVRNTGAGDHNMEVHGTLYITGAVTVDSTVDGRDIATDGTKLDGIASGANLYQDSDVESYGVGRAVATPVSGDWVIFSDAGVLKRGLFSALDETILTGMKSYVDGLDHHTKYNSTDNSTDHASISVTAHSDVTSAGSGIIISSAERTALHAKYTNAEAVDAIEAVAGALPTDFNDSVIYVDNTGVLKQTAWSNLDDSILSGLSSSNWNTAYGWGDHASAGYLTSETSHADVLQDGDFASNGLMKRTGAGTYGIVTDNSSNWNTAYGWGDHASGGYASSGHSHSSLSTLTADINMGGYDLEVIGTVYKSDATGWFSRLSSNGLDTGTLYNVGVYWDTTNNDTFLSGYSGTGLTAGNATPSQANSFIFSDNNDYVYFFGTSNRTTTPDTTYSHMFLEKNGFMTGESNENFYIQNDNYYTGSWRRVSGGAPGMIQMSDGNIYFYSSTSSTANSTISWTEMVHMQRTNVDFAVDVSFQSNPLLEDIANLTDPNADRILFWDDSAGGVAYMAVGSGLQISGGTTIQATHTSHPTGNSGHNKAFGTSSSTVSQGNHVHFSDERLKTDFSMFSSDALSILNRIEIYEYSWDQEKTEYDPSPMIGFKAGQVHEVDSRLTMVKEGRTNLKGKRHLSDLKAVDTNAMNALLIQAIRQLEARIEELEVKS